MRITLSVLLATLTIYCSSSVLSLPPSLIATAASLGRHYARQKRSNQGAVAAAAAATDHLLLQPNVVTDSLPPHAWQTTLLSKKDPRFILGGKNIASNGYTGTEAANDDITQLSSFELNNNAGNKMTHPNHVSGNKLSEKAKDAHERRGGNAMIEFNRKLPSEYDLNTLLASAAAAGHLELQRDAAQSMGKQQQSGSALWRRHMQPADVAPRIRAMQMKEFFTPLKYWAHHCQSTEHNCPQEYYRALFADRSRAAAAAAKQMDDFTPSVAGDAVAVQPTANAAGDDDDDDVNMNAHAFVFGGGDPLANFNDDAAVDNVYNEAGEVADMASSDGDHNNEDDDDDDDEDTNAANDILMLLNGEQDVMKFLSWAMQQLYPYQHFANKSGNGGAEYYHPGMFNWKKFNLSGHLEPPLLVEEPHYVIVRREQLEEDLQPGARTANRQSTQRSSPYLSVFNFNHGPQYKADPFIPPRGRKHNLPDLDALLNRYETFVPNRGKRDRIKDIFKYDDLFFPNRGKKQQKPPKATALALNGQSQRHYDDETNDLKGIGSANEGNSDYVGDRALLLDSQVDDSDDNSKTYSDTIDSNLEADGDSNGDGENDAIVSAFVGWPLENDDNAALTSNQINGTDQSDKSSMPKIGAINALTHAMLKRPVMIAAQPQHWRSAFKNRRMRRVAGIFAGATRLAANRLRSMSTVSQRHRHLRSEQFQKQQQKKQTQRRTTWQMSLPPSNQVRTNINDLDRLPWRLVKQKPKQRHNKNALTAQHLPLTWLQHLPVEQELTQSERLQQLQRQLQQHLLDRVDGVDAGRSSPPETLDIDRIYFSI
ncbi:uncharacterized protein LOC128871804 [Anastrepha ludens]|uniref:uncharacterized protein LOC128871804 n=1 Tax=Anastrepha ludens TaxID=28586 RepID=UPI0023B1CF1C|nr:uncharacterized protein LOC128871804 [Anastrepha ludens]